jgi:hypothetical protein
MLYSTKHINQEETKMNIPSTRNEAWGFYGTMEEHAKKAWPLAARRIAKATGMDPNAVRAFLDSRHGRHFADDVLNGLYDNLSLTKALDAAVDRWMGWTISKQTSKEHGIPKGLPYLTGFVGHCGIIEEEI